MTTSSHDLVRKFYLDEITDHVSYRALADGERKPRLREILSQSATIELKHSTFWKHYLERRGSKAPLPRPRQMRVLMLRFLQKLVNPVFLVAALELGESRALKAYFQCLRTFGLDDREKAGLRTIILEEIEHEVTFRRESEQLGLGNIRDFVLGMNDGLVEVLGVVTGLSAVYAASPLLVAVSGLVVGVAGALSMGIGAFISVRSQRQVNEGDRERMEVLFEVAPERAVEEYRDRLVASGVPADSAGDIARSVGTNRDAISRLLLAETRDNEVRSGLFTAAAYLVGASFPLLPYFFANNALVALLVSVLLAGLALSTVAAVISTFSGISLRKKVFEMVVSGFGAAALSFAFGKALQHFTGIEA